MYNKMIEMRSGHGVEYLSRHSLSFFPPSFLDRLRTVSFRQVFHLEALNNDALFFGEVLDAQIEEDIIPYCLVSFIVVFPLKEERVNEIRSFHDVHPPEYHHGILFPVVLFSERSHYSRTISVFTDTFHNYRRIVPIEYQVIILKEHIVVIKGKSKDVTYVSIKIYFTEDVYCSFDFFLTREVVPYIDILENLLLFQASYDVLQIIAPLPAQYYRIDFNTHLQPFVCIFSRTYNTVKMLFCPYTSLKNSRHCLLYKKDSHPQSL
jgi:hypothetical protein